MNYSDVSVVIPYFNASQTILRCLDSVATQTVRPLEIIIVDDGSTDDILPIIDKWIGRNSIPLNLLRQENRGAPSARNAGIRAAKGRYIALLDADDVWMPAKLEIQREIMERERLVLCGHGYLFDATDLSSDIFNFDLSLMEIRKLNRWNFAYRNPLYTPTVMFDKENFSGFDERFRRGDDYKAWVENYHQDRFGYLSLVLAAGFKRPIGQSGLTASIYKMHLSHLEVLKSLYLENKINSAFYISAMMIEFIKFPLRYVYSKFRVKS